jgi:hypothetical protein
MSTAPRIAVDFDNTVVDYQGEFCLAAVEEGLIDEGTLLSKTAVREDLRHRGLEDAWTELQGRVYGPGMDRAPMYPGVSEFFGHCRKLDVAVAIISHRTLVPFLGAPFDLHDAARRWLERNGFFEPSVGLDPSNVFFEVTAADKLERIRSWRATHAIDDLPEFLGREDWPPGVIRVLFDPHDTHAREVPFPRARSWADLSELLLHA